MSTTRPSNQIPKIKLHRASGQRYVQFQGKRRYLGRDGSPQVATKYERLIGAWLANGRLLTEAQIREILDPPDPIDAGVTVNQVCDAFETWAAERYRRADGRVGGEQDNYKRVLMPLRRGWGSSPAASFGPTALRALRDDFVELRWSRKGVNRAVCRVRRVFKWARSMELIGTDVHVALATVEALRRGESQARETKRVGPVPIEHVEAIRNHVSKQVWALIQLQVRTGARAGELVGLRAIDLDTSGKVWRFKMTEHKTAHHGCTRTLYFGPAAQEILKPFLAGRAVDAPLFSPIEAEADRLAALHAKRKTPMGCGNGPGRNRKPRPRRTPGCMYTTGSYSRAIARGCKGAGVPHWHSHQLRHLACDLIERVGGIEAARVVLGHTTLDTTAIYSGLTEEKAVAVMSKIG